MRKLWANFNGYVSLNDEQEEALFTGNDAERKTAMETAIRTHGIELCGLVTVSESGIEDFNERYCADHVEEEFICGEFQGTILAVPDCKAYRGGEQDV